VNVGDVAGVEPLKAISFGAGKQSTALVLMAIEGEIDADCAIFADTQDEPVAVYEHLWRMAERCAKVGFPLYVVTAGRLSDEVAKFDDALRVSGGHGGRYGDELFVHDSMVPLRQVDLSTAEDRGQGSLFVRGDCMGLCGV
jgi:hypothetical protein